MYNALWLGSSTFGRRGYRGRLASARRARARATSRGSTCRASLSVATAFVLALCGAAAAQQGELAPGDAQLASGEFVDAYPHEGVAGSTLLITLTSTEFDPYLIVMGPDRSVVAEVDDSAGQGLGVAETVSLPSDGAYLIGVTSARPGETGAYLLAVSVVTPGGERPAPVGGPSGPSNAASGAQPQPGAHGTFAGTFSDGRLTAALAFDGAAYSGEIRLDGQTYAATAAELDGRLTGAFVAAGQTFPFEAALDGDVLTLVSGGATYRLARTSPAAAAPSPGPQANPIGAASPAGPPASAATAPPAQATPAALEPRIAPRPGHVTGTVFDTRGRPLPGAGVMVRGVTFASGEAVSFETATGPDGTYSVRVPDGRYEAKAWLDLTYDGTFFSLLLHPVSGNPHTEIDTETGGNIDFQWRTAGLRAGSVPPGHESYDFYGASVDLSYCGLPASAYCDMKYESYDGRPIAPAGSRIRVTLMPAGPLVDGSDGSPWTYEFDIEPQDADYPYGASMYPGYPDGGGGRTVLGAGWQYHGFDLNDIPLGVYQMSVDAVFPDGRVQAMRVGLARDDVEHTFVPVRFLPWEDFHARSYTAGGIAQTTVYVRD